MPSALITAAAAYAERAWQTDRLFNYYLTVEVA
jgi:hypothetical protein